MSDQLGPLLRQMRQSRRWSMAELASRAGINRVTLNRWETGRFLPRLPELQAVLDALQVLPAQRARVLALLDRPRALTLDALPGGTGPADATGLSGQGGDLLRAMRLRRGWTLEQVAHRVGVAQNTLSRWERGDSWPSVTNLHALCFALGALEAELCALTRGRFGFAPAGEVFCLEEAEAAFNAMRPLLVGGRYDPLADLRVLTLIGQLRALARQGGSRQAIARLQGRVHAHYAQYLYLYGRYKEAARLAYTVTEEATPQNLADHHVRAFINAVRASTQTGGRRARREGVESLRAWLPPIRDRRHLAADYVPWILEMIADLLSQDGNAPEAVEAMRCSMEMERYYKGEARPTVESSVCIARLLVRAGRSSEALPYLENGLARIETGGSYPAPRVRVQLLYSEVLRNLGQRHQASGYLLRAWEDMAIFQLDYLMPEMQSVAHTVMPDLDTELATERPLSVS